MQAPSMSALRRAASCALFLSFSCALAAAQGDTGFLRGEGKLDLALSYTEDQYDEFWVGNSKMSAPPVGEVTREAFTLYAAYGLTDELDLVGSASYVMTESDGTGGFSDEDDLQDAVLGVKWRLWRTIAGANEFSILLAPAVKTPMSSYEDNEVTALGDGQTDLRGRVIGHYQHTGGFYASLETGYDWRDKEPDNEIPVNVTLGYTFLGRFTLSPFYSRVDSQGGPDIGMGSFPEVEEDYTRYGVGGYLRVTDGFGVTGMWRTTDDGKNTGDADSFSAGIVVRL
jgi:hypothetical protein